MMNLAASVETGLTRSKPCPDELVRVAGNACLFPNHARRGPPDHDGDVLLHTQFVEQAAGYLAAFRRIAVIHDQAQHLELRAGQQQCDGKRIVDVATQIAIEEHFLLQRTQATVEIKTSRTTVANE